MTLDYRKVTDSESATLFPKRGQMDLSEYIDMLGNTNDGDVVEVKLHDTTLRSMKRRIGMAAKAANRLVRFSRKPTSNNVVVFQVNTRSKTSSKKNTYKKRTLQLANS